MNPRYLWIAYVPIKLHIVFAMMGGGIGHWIAGNYAWPILLGEIAGLVLFCPIGILLQCYKQQAQEVSW